MNVYDFDGTIYDGDSSRDFIIYCYMRHPFCALKRLPGVAVTVVSYLTKRIRLGDMKAKIFGIVADLPDRDVALYDFWNKHEKKIRPWYYGRKREDDVICSASPEFLLEEIIRRLGLHALIGTRLDAATGALIGENCKGEEKIPRFRAVFPDAEVEEFYSDSRSDTPLAKIAKKAYLVKGNQESDIVEWTGLS